MRDVINTGQYEAWNGYEGEHWADHADRYDALNVGFNDVLLDAAAITARDRVLDIGCGTGQATRLAARRAPSGSATGVDLSTPMLARARDLAEREDVANVAFEQGDAQIVPFPEGGYDVAISRFGVMFFADPVAAFGNVRRGLREGGRLAFLCLTPRKESQLAAILAEITPPSRTVTGPDGTGPLSLSDPEHVNTVLSEAGFHAITCRRVEAEQVWGRDAADAAQFIAAWGPVRHNLGEGPEIREKLTTLLRPHERDGAVRLRTTAWLVTARR